ncbi:MAG: hypothetical protein JXA57_15445 [Armatimonadetes bacterium]|nr:hypothetical protein [Armatimonadota bacterium]
MERLLGRISARLSSRRTCWLAPVLLAIALATSPGCAGTTATPVKPTAPTSYEEAMALIAEAKEHYRRALSIPYPDAASEMEAAIADYEAALPLVRKEEHPAEWAMAMNNLAVIYKALPSGDRAANSAEAERCYLAALTVVSKQSHPQLWVTIANNLGVYYAETTFGDRSQNIERGIDYLRQALRVCEKEASPRQWAITSADLGAALVNRLAGDRHEDLEEARRHLEPALRVHLDNDDVLLAADASLALGLYYYFTTEGDRTENLSRARDLFRGARRVYDKIKGSERWGIATLHLSGSILADREHLTAADLEEVRGMLDEVLPVWTRESDPSHWAEARECLAYVCLCEHPHSAEHLRQALDLFMEAIRGYEDAGDRQGAERTRSLWTQLNQRLREMTAD